MIKRSGAAPTRSSPHPARPPPRATCLTAPRAGGERGTSEDGQSEARGGGQRRHLGRGEERSGGRAAREAALRAARGGASPRRAAGSTGAAEGKRGTRPPPGRVERREKKARGWGGGKSGAGPRRTWKARGRRRRVRKPPPRLPPSPPTRAARPGIFVGAGAGRLLTMVAGGRQASSPAAGSAEPRSGCRARTLGAAAGPAARSAPSLRQWLLALTRNGAQRARAGARAALTLGGGGGASHIRAPAAPRTALAKGAERGSGVCGGRGRGDGAKWRRL